MQNHNRGFIQVLTLLAIAAVALGGIIYQSQPQVKEALFGAPATQTFQKSLIPITDSTYYLGTTSPSTVAWLGLIVDQICLSGDCKSAWPTGGGSGGGTWATTTSTVVGQLVNYPLNDTDVVAIGANSTTTSEFWFDPNNSRSKIPYASTTALSAAVLCLDGDTCLSTWPTGGGSAYEVATTSDIAVSQVAYISKTSGRTTLASVATGTVSSSGGITTTANRSVIGGALSIACDVASGSIPGCLSSTDWTTFNNKQGTISVAWPITLSGAQIGFSGLSTTSDSGMAQGNLYVGSGGKFQTAASSSIFGYTPEQTLTFTFPLSRSGNTVTGLFSTTTDTKMSQGSLYIGTGGIMQTAASSSIFGYTPLNPTRQLTVAGTAQQITSSAGAQDLSADRTWTLSLPSHVVFPSSYQAAAGTTTNSTSTNLSITNLGQGWLYTLGDGYIKASTTPNVEYINATSTSATSTFSWAIRATCFTTNGTTCISGSGGSSNWTDGGAYLSPITAGDGVLINSASSTITNLSMLYASTTNLFVGTLDSTSDAATQYGKGTNNSFIEGLDYDQNTFVIASGTALGTNNLLSITKGGKLTFNFASTTAWTNTGVASTSVLRIDTLADGCLNIASGLVGSQACGGGGFTWPFPSNATTTHIAFNTGGYSADIGSTTQATSTGLTVTGNLVLPSTLASSLLWADAGSSLRATTTPTATTFYSTGVVANRFPYASSTALTVGTIFAPSNWLHIQGGASFQHDVETDDGSSFASTFIQDGGTYFQVQDGVTATSSSITLYASTGRIGVSPADTAAIGYLDFTKITGTNKTVYVPNLNGSLALGSYDTGYLSGSVPFGSSGLLATSSSLTFDGTRLNMSHGSTTGAFSSAVFCLTGDSCISTWPTGGGGANSKWATSSGSLIVPNGGGGILVNSGTSTITNLRMVNASSTDATTTNQTITGNWIVPQTSALLLTDAGGTVGEYAGGSCTNQFVRSVNGAGVLTCATVDLAADVTGTLPIARGGTGTTTSAYGHLYYGSASAMQTVATTSVSCSGGTSCSSFTAIGASPITISSTAPFTWPFPGNSTTTHMDFVTGGYSASIGSTTQATSTGLTVTGNLVLPSTLASSLLWADGGASLRATTTPTALSFYATSNTASQFPYASSTAWSSRYASSTVIAGYQATIEYASTTAITVSGVASTSLFFADGLINCNTNNVLTWTNGVFGCEADDGGAGGAANSKWATSTNNVDIFTNGAQGVGIGSSTPWGMLSIQPSVIDYSKPLLVVATSSEPNGGLFGVFATTSVLSNIQNRATNVLDSGVRVAIGVLAGVTRPFGTLLDQLNVNGRINTGEWMHEPLRFCGASINTAANNICGTAWSWQKDGNGFLSAPTGGGSTTGGKLIFSMCNDTSSSCSLTAAAANAGVGVFLPAGNSTGFLYATNTPVMDVYARILRPQNATSSAFYIGYSNLNPAGTTYETEPTIGCYFTASSTATGGNWYAVCRQSSAAATYVNTGIASSTSITNTGSFMRFRIETSNAGAKFYLTNSSTTALLQVANITSNYSATTTQVAGIWTARGASAGLSQGFDFGNLNLWVLNPLIGSL